MIVLEPLPVRQARARQRRAEWFTVLLGVAAVVALVAMVASARYSLGGQWWLAGLTVVTGFWWMHRAMNVEARLTDVGPKEMHR